MAFLYEKRKANLTGTAPYELWRVAKSGNKWQIAIKSGKEQRRAAKIDRQSVMESGKAQGRAANFREQ